MKRTLFFCAVIVCALVAAFAATRARRLGLRVESFAVTPGGSVDNAPNVGDDLPFAPFRFAVVGPMIVGDHGGLGTAMDEIRRRGDVDFVLVTGQLLESGRLDGAERLAAACRDRGVEVLAVPGTEEDGSRPEMAPSRAVIERYVSPLAWSFRHRTWRFETDERGSLCDGRPFARVLASQDGTRARASVAEVPDEHCGLVTSRRGSLVPVRIWSVARDDPNLLKMAEEFTVPGGTTPASLWRDLALGTIFPLVRSAAGHVAFLAVCAIAAALAITRLRPARPEAPPGSAVRTPS